MNRKSFIALCVLTVFFSSCNTSNYEGFTRIDGSIHYKLITIGDDGLQVANSEYITMDLKVISDSTLLARKTFNRVSLDASPFPEYLDRVLQDAMEGDSIHIIGRTVDMNLDKLLGQSIQTHDSTVLVYLSVNELFNDSTLRARMAHERMIKDYELREKRDLNRVLDSLGMGQDHLINGIYLKQISAGSGEMPEKGDFVITNYILKLPNGKELANTYITEPFEYQTGKPDQAISGFAIGVYEMSFGGEYFLVVPSNLGFGTKGSSSGLVPPYSILVYRVELVESPI